MKQQRIDFDRAAQLGILRAAVLPRVEIAGKGVDGGLLKHLLRVLDDYCRGNGECFAAVTTLAARLGKSERHTRRAIAALEQLSLITTCRQRSRYGPVTNHHRIVWTELALRCPPHEPDPGSEQPDPGSEQPDPGSEQPDPGSEQPDPGSEQPDPGSEQPDPGSGKPYRSAIKRTTPTAPTNFPLGPVSWPVVVGLLESLGLSPANVTTTVRRVERRGVTAAEALQLVAHYQAHPGAWRSVGVIICALRAVTPGKPPRQCFPTPDQEYLDRERRREFSERQRRIAQEEQERTGAASLRARAEAEQLEQVHGAAWDQLPAAERRALLRTYFPFVAERPLDSPLVRECGLSALAERARTVSPNSISAP